MHLVLQLVFWSCVGALVHSYLLYPVLVRRAARGRPGNREIHGDDLPPERWPRITVILAAHNEEAVIRAALSSVFAATYPPGRLEVYVGADNCTDRTGEIVEAFQASHPNLHLRRYPGRNGKITVVNRLAAECRAGREDEEGHLLVLMDANVRWSAALPRELARHFRNPRIGLVAANVLDGRAEDRGIAHEEEAYVNRENAVKHAEGVLWGRMMGAFGACYAVRARLFDPVPLEFLADDFFQTMRCFEQGHDAIVELRAVCFEDVSESISEEFRRKRRIATGNYQNLARFGGFLTPWRGGAATSFAFWSHKGARYLGPFLLLGALGSSALLAALHPLYALAFAGQAGLILLAASDVLLDRMGLRLRPLRWLRYFYYMNLAMLLGAIRWMRGSRAGSWKPTRRVAAGNPAADSRP